MTNNASGCDGIPQPDVAARVWRSLIIPAVIIVVTLFQGSYSAVTAQNQVEIIRADRLVNTVIDGRDVLKLLGNFHLVTGDMDVRGDSAFRFLNPAQIHAFNIEIDTGNEIIWADTLYHDADLDISEFRGRVIIETENNTLFSDAIDFDHSLEVAEFLAPVRFLDERGELVAGSGYYIQSNDIAFFEENVQLRDDAQYLEADSLYMNRRDDFYQLFNRVYVRNEDENVTFAANYVETDSAGYRLLRDNAWMMQVSEGDTTHISARIIEIQESDSLSTIAAFSHPDSVSGVHIWSNSFSARSDTLHYRDDTEEFRLVSNPIAWYESTQLTGPFIRAQMENEEISFLEAYDRPVIVQEDSVTGRLNQMTGDTLNIFFDNGDIQRIEMFDNSAIIFHLKDDSGAPARIFDAGALGPGWITFIEGEPDFLWMGNNLNGTLPEDSLATGDSLATERQLPGFRWDPEMRPGRPVVREPRHIEFPEELPFDLPPRYRAHLQQTGRTEADTRPEQREEPGQSGQTGQTERPQQNGQEDE